ncbi:MAG: dihydrofolate reductase family protein [Dehalococcoidia bacterium]|nr:dihydrofolate reductase family protein [Dehalococcoidia bacterium]
MFDGGHVDEVHAYVAPLILGPAGIPLVPSGPGPAPFALREVAIEPLPPDVLIRGYTGDWSP